jgi:hypothetical protein
MSGSPPTQFYERRKKSRCDVDASEGSSRTPQPGTSTKRTMHRDYPRGRMHIDTEIKELEEDPMEISDDDESTKDETYRMSPMPVSENSAKEDNESNNSGAGHEAIEEEEGSIEGTLNPHSHRRDPFHPSHAIRVLHKSLCFVVKSYKGKGATTKVKKMQKIDPRSQQRDASDYIFHTHFQQNLYDMVIMDRRQIMSEA